MQAVPLPSVVRLGGVAKPDLLVRLRENHVMLNPAAETLFADDRFSTLHDSTEIEIAYVSPADLGFDNGATYEQLKAKALESGLTECPLELGPHLRLQHPDQLEGSAGFPATKHRAPPGSITVASPPLDDSEETPKGFYLRRIDGALWLRGYWSDAANIWRPEDVLVFMRNPGRGTRGGV